ncbi:MAG: TonB-dependent receptor plug domain-containing protein, partial [Chlorobi bacterium]|nr:TonB-dependent receptor plug domain-containing protein [Chlorobiota bacterium]
MKKKTTVGKTQWSILQKILITMRLTMFLVILGVSQVFAGQGFSQSSNLTLTLKNSSIENILFQIEEQSEYTFLYNKDLVDVKRRIDIDVKDKNIDAILFAIFKGQDVKIHKVNNNIIISPKFISRQDKKTVSGKVTDKSNQPLPGVTILIKGTTQGTVTGIDGNYSLPSVPVDATLVFSFVGMKTQEVPVSGRSSINVTMQEETIGIEEVVAIGYGTIKKADLTGAVSVVKPDEFKNITALSVGDAMQGLVPGVNIRSSGNIGSEPVVEIRGLGNFTNNNPLYVIDGLPTTGNRDFNVNDIKSI